MEPVRSLITDNNKAFEEFLAAGKYLISDTASDERQFNPLNGICLKTFDFEGKQDSAAEPISIGQRELAKIRYFHNRPRFLDGSETPFLSSSSIISQIFIVDYKNYERIDPGEIYGEGRVARLISSMQSRCQEYSSQGWDGYDAQPIDRKACHEAMRFVRLLPFNIDLPEVLPEPTGAIALEWYKKRDHVFVASLSGNGIIEYAGLFGSGNKSYGSERLGGFMPPIILHHIHRILGNDLGNCKA
jgi:hypothetical protein